LVSVGRSVRKELCCGSCSYGFALLFAESLEDIGKGFWCGILLSCAGLFAESLEDETEGT